MRAVMTEVFLLVAELAVVMVDLFLFLLLSLFVFWLFVFWGVSGNWILMSCQSCRTTSGCGGCVRVCVWGGGRGGGGGSMHNSQRGVSHRATYSHAETFG